MNAKNTRRLRFPVLTSPGAEDTVSTNRGRSGTRRSIMKTRTFALIVLVFGVALLPAIAWAQGGASGGIAGVARDMTGAVLPGVTVEAASPALIEKTRVVVTDDQGLYRIVDLRPGTYSVTF